MAGTLADAALRLTAPDVTPTELTDIAAAHPDLRPAVAAHPNCHAELRAWIAQVAPPVPAPTGPPTLSPAPSTPVGRARLPWIVAAVAVVVALASVGVLAVRGSGGSTASGERGFASPGEAVEYVVARIAAGDMAGATEAFAVETMVAGYSFQAYGDRIGAVEPQTWLPASSAGYRTIDEGLRRGEVSRQLQVLVQSVVAPDREYGITIMLDGGLTAADVEAELAPESLADLSVMQFDELNRAGDRYSENFQAMAEPYGADELREVAVLYGTADGPALGGMQLLRYGDDWYVWTLTSALLGTGLGSVEPTSEQDYLEAIAQVQG